MAEMEGKGAPYPFFSQDAFLNLLIGRVVTKTRLDWKADKETLSYLTIVHFLFTWCIFFLSTRLLASLSSSQIFHIRPSSSDFRFFLRYVALTENLVLLRTATWHVKEKASDTQWGAGGGGRNLSPLTFERLFDTVFLLLGLWSFRRGKS